MMRVFIRNTEIRDTQTLEEKTQTCRGESHMKTEAEIGVIQPQRMLTVTKR